MVKRETDMGNLMLLLPDTETYEQIDPAVETQVGRIYGATPAPRTALLADSFYTVATFNDPQVFPGLEERHIDAPDAGDVIANADQLIINSVERAFLGRVEMGILHWSSSLGKALLARNAAAAQACTAFQSAARADEAGQVVVSMPQVRDGYLPCVRITLESAGTNLEIALPRRVADGYDTGFTPGRAIKQSVPSGRQVLTYIMPGYVAGRSLAVRPAGAPGSQVVVSLEIGEIPVP